jgi:hypothetical protein
LSAKYLEGGREGAARERRERRKRHALGQLGRLRVGVVAPDGVQDGHAVGDELLGRDRERQLALLHKPLGLAVVDVGKLDARVAKRRPTVLHQLKRRSAPCGVDYEGVSRQEALVASPVALYLDARVDSVVLVDKVPDRGREARCQAA